MNTERRLACALLWIRNHHDVVELKRKDMLPVKDRVIEVVDRVLKHSEPTAKEMAEFREFYNAR